MPRFSRSKRLGRRRVLQQHPSDVSGRHSIPFFWLGSGSLRRLSPGLPFVLLLTISTSCRSRIPLGSISRCFLWPCNSVGSLAFLPSLARREEEELICFLRFPTSQDFFVSFVLGDPLSVEIVSEKWPNKTKKESRPQAKIASRETQKYCAHTPPTVWPSWFQPVATWFSSLPLSLQQHFSLDVSYSFFKQFLWIFFCLNFVKENVIVANQDENKEPDDVRIDSVTDGPSWPAASVDVAGAISCTSG